MSKLVSVLIFGVMLALIPSFLFFVGLKVNYIDTYQIKEYYNAIFMDNIRWDYFAYVSLILGTLFVFPKKLYLGGLFFIITVGMATSMFIPSIAKEVAAKLFAKENFHIKKGKFIYKGTLLYEGRRHYYFRKDDSSKTITFKKDEIDETY